MEALVNCGIINPIRVFGFRNQRSRFLFASSTPHLRTGSLGAGFRIGMLKKKNNQCSPLVIAAAAAASIGGSQIGQFENTIPSKEVLELWKNGDAVCVDFDNTVCLDEGIDELAQFCGAGKAVAEWTARLSPGIEELVQKLKANGKHVYLIQEALDK